MEEQLDSSGSVDAEDSTESPLTLLLRQESIVEVREALAKLKVEKAQLLLLRHSGLSYREIADALQLGVNSVGQQLARAEAEFSALYQRQQRQNRKVPQLQAAKEGQ